MKSINISLPEEMRIYAEIRQAVADKIAARKNNRVG
ncbi:MAG: hypothetical protein RLZZ499_1484 [Cyanobacteriota bacterium]|jgi:hypothetical protein